MMPSTAESMTARHRASLAPSCPSRSHALRQVVQHARELALPSDPHLADRKMNRKQRAVTSSSGHLAADADDPGVAGCEVSLQVPVVLLVMRRRHQHADVAAEHFGFGIAEQLLRAAVERLDDALGVDDDDAVNRRVENRVEPFGTGRRRRRGRSLRLLRLVQAVIEPGDHQPGGDEHAERQLVRADRRRRGRPAAAGSTSRQPRERGREQTRTEPSVPGRNDDRRIELQVRNLQAERVTKNVTEEEGGRERSEGDDVTPHINGRARQRP